MKRFVTAVVCGLLVSWMGVGTAQGAGKMRHTLPAYCSFAQGYVTCIEPTESLEPGPSNGDDCAIDGTQEGTILEGTMTTTTTTRVYKGKWMKDPPVRVTTTTDVVRIPATCVADPVDADAG
jgi:hypothetical protein